MGSNDISRCIEVLNKKPRWFFQKEIISEKLRCFDVIQERGTPEAISSIINFLKDQNIQIKNKAAETVLHLFAKLKSYNEHARSLKFLDIKATDLEIYKADFDEKTYVQLLGIASLHANGYLREKAVLELKRIRHADGLQFVLWRLGDWVEAVRKPAIEAVSEYLSDTYADDVLQLLPTVDSLLRVERVDLSEIHNRMIQFLVNQDFTQEFYEKLKRLDDKSRWQFYKASLINSVPNELQINRIAEDANFLIRLELIKHLPKFEPKIQKEILNKFLRDRSAAVRLNALYASKKLSPEFDTRIEALLSDETASIRELSRHLLKRKGIDFTNLYRQRIMDRHLLSGSLLGLAETGTGEDLPIFEQNINGENKQLIVASLLAINKFNPERAKHHALKLLAHQSKKVRNKAIEILAKNMDPQNLESVRAIYAEGDGAIKMSVLKLFNKIGGWNIVGDLLLGLADQNLHVQNLAWQILGKWKLKAARLFTTPPKAELERANKIYDRLDPAQLNMGYWRKTILQDLKFFLR